MHVQHFLSQLTQADDLVRAQGVDRFQRKLTVPVCRELWHALLDRVAQSGERDVSIRRSVYEKVVRERIVGKFLQAYEVVFMMRIFDRVDTHAGYKPAYGSVQLTALVCALMLLSSEPDRCLKVSLLFEAFDADEDGCLLYDQIMAMMQCICAQKPLADENSRGARDIQFQEELATQEGLRYYERTRWSLQRDCKVEGGVVALRELWESLERQSTVLEELLPSMVRIHWVMVPSQAEEEAASPEPSSRQSSASEGTLDLAGGASKAFEKQGTPGRRNSRDAPKPFLAPPSPTPPIGRHRAKALAAGVAAGISWREERQGLSPVPSLNASQELTLQPGTFPLNPPEEIAADVQNFKESVTSRFRQALRFNGAQRVAELAEGFEQRVDLWGEGHDTMDGFRARTPQAAARHRPLVAVADSEVRPSSASGGDSQKGPARTHSASDLLAQAASTRQQTGLALKSVDCERWGAASTERFRLFCTVKSFGRHAMHDRQNQPDPESGIGFRCALCQCYHALAAGCC